MVVVPIAFIHLSCVQRGSDVPSVVLPSSLVSAVHWLLSLSPMLTFLSDTT